MTIKRFPVRTTIAPREAVFAATNTRTVQVDTPAQRFDHAMRHFETGHWHEAFAELSVLANRGHPVAARIALMMVRRGTSLFGGTFTATREEQAFWHRRCDS
jgi:hypothetical protein